MSLDLGKVASQVERMIATLKVGRQERQQHLQNALDTLSKQADQVSALATKIELSRVTWLVAGLTDGVGGHYPPPPIPDEFAVLATDGSHVDVDRHRSPRCYLINIGAVTLRYGSSPGATLDSLPYLYSGDEEMVIPPSGDGIQEQIIEGTLLGIKRDVAECGQLARLASGLPEAIPAVALLDGTLVHWNLVKYPGFVIEALLDKGFLSYLSQIKRLNNNGRQVAVASYISFPGSTEVVNTLRLALCPHRVLDTDRNCRDCTTRECEAVVGVRDRDIFLRLLEPGERSDLFISRSEIIKRYGEHQVYFFYLKIDDEVARVEVPRWVAMDEAQLNLVHSLVLDQCRRGQGYPVALSEAHEQAVVTGADRENFWQLVESWLIEEHLPSTSSAKSRSKRTRWL